MVNTCDWDRMLIFDWDFNGDEWDITIKNHGHLMDWA
jgi:hypothetical protein